MGRRIDETGNKYGELTVVKSGGTNKDKKALWLCKCSCGNYTTTTGKSLRNGSSTSCGCLKVKRAREMAKHNKKHGETNTKLYNVWRGIKKRCRLATSDAYANYGEKGIDVCDEWFESYECFRDWSLANGFEDGLTIDRIDPRGDYTPENCRWTTWKVQENNRGNTVFLEYKGKLYPRAILAEMLGVSRQALYYRVKHGIPLEKPYKNL